MENVFEKTVIDYVYINNIEFDYFVFINSFFP